MTDEMVSGPDLGGGYLHQLTVSPDSPTRRFTYHAQTGGADAGGPPAGPLEPFGFVHPESPCPFGGPRCWHREFEAPRAAGPQVRVSYNRMRFVLATLLEQEYSGRAPAIRGALEELAQRLGPPEEGGAHWWYIGGSTAAWLEGAKIAPRDIDLGVAPQGVPWVAEKLQEYLIEPLAHTTWARDRRMFAARAFVGSMREGARVEWGSSEDDPPDGAPFNEWSGDPRRVRTHRVSFEGRAWTVSRPEYAWVRALEKGREDPAARIREVVLALGPDLDLLQGLLDRSSLPLDSRNRLLSGLRA